MNPIKVAHVTTVDISLRFLLQEQIQYLQAAGYEVAGVSSPGQEVADIKAAGIRHIPVPMTRNFTPLADLASLWRLYRVMRRERFTIVHTHNPKPSLLGQLAARFAGVPIVVNTVHGFYFHEHMPARARRFYILIEKIAALCSDLILSQNREDIDTALREKICSPEQIKHLGNGIDVTLFDPQRFSCDETQRRRDELGIPRDAKVVGFVGRLAAKRKGFLDFLRAGAEIAKVCPETHFVIAGESDYGKPDAVDPSTAKEYGIWDRCHFLGTLPNCELPEVYTLMDVVVLPSLFEGIPRVLMEAAAMSIPLVATDVKGNREAVAHGKNGLLVPLGDVKALAESVLGILQDRECARRMGQEGYRMAVTTFDQRMVFERVKREYARLLEQKGLTAPEAMAAAAMPACS